MIFGSGHMDLFKDLTLEAGVNLDRFTSFRVGGPADLLAMPETVEQLVSTVKTAGQHHIPVTLLGGGTNTLVSDRGIRGLVIVLTAFKTGPEKLTNESGTKIFALAGERLSTLCRFAAGNGLSGLEWAAGIPGTLGGAVMMNAGAHGSDMAAVIESVEILEGTRRRTIAAKDLSFGYRGLDLEGAVLLSAVMALAQDDPQKIKTRFERNLAAKRTSQPVSKASGGCFFKNPSGEKPAGYLIEQAGLKGYTHRGAMVSDLHANFIINRGSARCTDILALKQVVQDRVYDQFGIRLESEVKAIGE